MRRKENVKIVHPFHSMRLGNLVVELDEKKKWEVLGSDIKLHYHFFQDSHVKNP